MINNRKNLPMVYLKPGEVHIATKPKLIMTVLGSCLSVTLFNRSRHLGGICHSLLPHCDDQTVSGDGCQKEFKHVSCSLMQMIKVFDHYGVLRSEIEVKCFGGADMFSEKGTQAGPVSIGRQNILQAEKILQREGLALKVKDVGGQQGRKIFFYTHTGEVLLQRLGSENAPDLVWQKIMKQG